MPLTAVIQAASLVYVVTTAADAAVDQKTKGRSKASDHFFICTTSMNDELGKMVFAGGRVRASARPSTSTLTWRWRCSPRAPCGSIGEWRAAWEMLPWW